MSNPFDGLLSAEVKILHANAIKEVIRGCQRPCRLEYGITEWTECINCYYSSTLGRSSNRYKTGGPLPFPHGQICPYCQGAGRIGTETTEDINLCVLWDYKDWIQLGSWSNIQTVVTQNIQSPAGYVQTFSVLVSTLPKLKRAKVLIAETSLELYEQHRFQRFGEPQPCGFESDFLVCMWERIG